MWGGAHSASGGWLMTQVWRIWWDGGPTGPVGESGPCADMPGGVMKRGTHFLRRGGRWRACGIVTRSAPCAAVPGDVKRGQTNRGCYSPDHPLPPPASPRYSHTTPIPASCLQRPLAHPDNPPTHNRKAARQPVSCHMQHLPMSSSDLTAWGLPYASHTHNHGSPDSLSAATGSYSYTPIALPCASGRVS